MTTTSPGQRKTGLTDLPPELREIIVRNLIHSVLGPEVYVGLGSRTAVPIPPVTIYLLPHFRSSVTDTIEIGFDDDSSLSKHLEQSWTPAYGKLRPLMACKTLYYEATAIFFREKHFVLGSSTYAHAWLRRIGQRNQVNLRSIRLKIHKELFATGNFNESGSQWIEVLKKLGRSARQLKVLSFQFDHDDDPWRSPLLKSFLRMKSFQNLKLIDFFHVYHPQPMEFREFLAMVVASTGCPLVRCLKRSAFWEPRCILVRQAFIDDEEQINVSADIQAEV